ncbi:MAG TPA: methyltransferase domain-containing protein [Xanthobacteraceae bacterium]|nr:methyltransferase domain-containing protein [Xanthobacteraceae bacterium]
MPNGQNPVPDDASESSSDYVLGHSERELARLERQAGFFADATREVLVRAGLAPGMRVLDVGCGVGDVSAIAADLVGPTGSVVGIDISQEALAIAQLRMKAAGKGWVSFSAATMESFAGYDGFDAVVGRFILIHVGDPAAFLRDLVGRLRPGATLAFAEMDLSTAASVPPLPLLSENIGRIVEVYRRTGRQADMGSGLFAAFRAAGLDPRLIGLTRIGGAGDPAAVEFVVESVRSLLPAMEMLGIAGRAAVDVDTLAQRLAAEAAGVDPCIFYPRLVGAFATVG